MSTSAEWPAAAEYDAALAAIRSASKSRIDHVSKLAVREIKYYKLVVYHTERAALRARPEQRLPYIFVIDAICRRSQAQNGAKDPLTPRFGHNLAQTLRALRPDDPQDQETARKTVERWSEKRWWHSSVIDKAYAQLTPHDPDATPPEDGDEPGLSPPPGIREDLPPAPASAASGPPSDLTAGGLDPSLLLSHLQRLQQEQQHLQPAGAGGINLNLDFGYDDDDEDEETRLREQRRQLELDQQRALEQAADSVPPLPGPLGTGAHSFVEQGAPDGAAEAAVQSAAYPQPPYLQDHGSQPLGDFSGYPPPPLPYSQPPQPPQPPLQQAQPSPPSHLGYPAAAVAATQQHAGAPAAYPPGSLPPEVPRAVAAPGYSPYPTLPESPQPGYFPPPSLPQSGAGWPQPPASRLAPPAGPAGGPSGFHPDRLRMLAAADPDQRPHHLSDGHHPGASAAAAELSRKRKSRFSEAPGSGPLREDSRSVASPDREPRSLASVVSSPRELPRLAPALGYPQAPHPGYEICPSQEGVPPGMVRVASTVLFLNPNQGPPPDTQLLREVLAPFGTVSHIRLMLRCGFVTMTTRAAAEAAKAVLPGLPLFRAIRVGWGRGEGVGKDAQDFHTGQALLPQHQVRIADPEAEYDESADIVWDPSPDKPPASGGGPGPSRGPPQWFPPTPLAGSPKPPFPSPLPGFVSPLSQAPAPYPAAPPSAGFPPAYFEQPRPQQPGLPR